MANEPDSEHWPIPFLWLMSLLNYTFQSHFLSSAYTFQSEFLDLMKKTTHTLLNGDNIFTDYKGALTEQYVFQQLRISQLNDIYYWSADNSQGEIDFMVQHEADVFPIEVKAAENLQAKSLRLFVERNPQLHGIRFSMARHREQDWLTNYPLYAVGVDLK